MSKSTTISADELRDRLAHSQPLTVLDIRPEDEYETWHVPTSHNLPIYDELAQENTQALQQTVIDEEPVVTVCGRGAMAAKATDALRAQGVDARTLEGGLRAWSTAWNTAQMQLASQTTIIQLRRVGKGCLSYLLANEQAGRAVAVDPALDASIFQALAEDRGWEIDAVLETHLHADHVSRARPLAEATGASHILPAGEPATFAHEPIEDGEVITIGSMRIEAIATPGHTPASATFLVDEAAALTGDTLFLDALGRPDLDAEDQERSRARALHASVARLLELPEETWVLPAHADHPLGFDGEMHTARLGELPERIQLLGLEEKAFIEAILDRLPDTPANHERIIAHNREARWPTEEITELEAGANRCAAG